MKKNRIVNTALGLAAAALLAAPAVSSAQEGNWLVRLRAIDVVPNASSDIAGLDVGSRWAPELDFTYFFTPNFAAELILATTKHSVTLSGTSLGDTWVLPPTITLQYHFTDLGAFKPYVGAGLNLTWFYNTELNTGKQPLTLSSPSVGPALQAGMDFEIAKNWYLNADVKYIWINTDVKANGATITKLDINPWVFGVGVGYRF